MKLKIATSQFPVSADKELNRDCMLKQMKSAKQSGCDVVHFPEGSLSGYAGVDFATFDNYDWELLKQYTEEIMLFAKELRIWVIFGSAHLWANGQKPFNSVYVINNEGQIADRYDKLFCSGDAEGKTGDLAYYSSGNHFTMFTINGVNCSVQICHDYRYPELYRELKNRGAEVVFHSYHAGNLDGERLADMEAQVGEENELFNWGSTYPEITMPATMVSYAANNYVWISCSNTSAKQSCWGSFLVRPDGVITGRLHKNKEGLLIREIDTDKKFYDGSAAWRERAINGIYFSGERVKDLRDRTKL